MFVEADNQEPRPVAPAQPRFDAAALDAELGAASPREIVEAAIRAAPGRVAVVSSFGTESAVLLKFAAEVDPSLPVLFLDTQWLFKETLAYRDALIARLGLTDVRTVMPSPSALALRDPKRELAFRDRDACCEIRKVTPLAQELAAFDAWMSGRKRYHGGERTALPAVEADGPRLKFNPLARLSRPELNAVFATAKLPRHPLESLGFTSVGCVPCTHKPAPGDSVRGGRWSGLGKTECGIHLGPLPAPANR
ncbi:MAG TPA: phosphoadenylyl-sulfate reductase [Xanthobacteraceae bacterium]|nr:phosphoadenylyl-sulfate reductase [Xanthobacteraceae bacterium]